MKISKHKGQLTHLFLFSHVDLTQNNILGFLLRAFDQKIVIKNITLVYITFMKEQTQSFASRRTNTFCCYRIETNEDEQPKQPGNFFERMPMLGRNISSGIKFKNVEHNNKQPIYQLLNDLYEGSNSPSSIYTLLSNKRINPIIHGSQERDDLQYYIPQIITYMVLENNLKDEELILFIIKGCSTDFYFAHRVYFYLKSLSENHNGQIITSVLEFLDQKFIKQMSIYKNCKLSGIEFTKSMIMMDHQLKDKPFYADIADQLNGEIVVNDQQANRQSRQDQHMWERYGTKRFPMAPTSIPKPIIKVMRKRYYTDGFMETPRFWDDMLEIGNKVINEPFQQRNNKLNTCIMEINQKLPANVYIPFFKDEIRLYTILCLWKGRLFSTNQRAPFSIWVEIYREEEQLNLEKVFEVQQQIQMSPQKNQKKKNFLQKFYDTISKPFSISGQKNTLNIKRFFTEKLSLIEEASESSIKSKSKKSVTKSFVDNHYSISQLYKQRQKLAKSQGGDSIGERSSLNQIQNDEPIRDVEEEMKQYFGPKSSDYIEEMREKSIYRQLKSWRLIHLMVKTGDDIKQQQFAMQLVNRFQYAFTKEKVDCLVFPYEVISLGSDCGIIQMLNDITTLDSLFQKLHKKSMTLRQFFDSVYPNPRQARRNFMRSLAGYSLLTYFLQVKDRHNGNILLSREGYIIHIDFGFFLSNAPGKGVELQKKSPFKFLTSYVQVIGHLNSEQFFEFRQLFYKGFRAILKEREAILTLVKMMYSSHMESMGCFIRGETAIEELQNRFSIQQHVQSFCYDLINSSLDNWRARWYDKFQYFLQKIYY